MGCCCSQDKETSQEEGYDERSRLIPHTTDLNQKSRFVDSNNQTINAMRSGGQSGGGMQSNANNLQNLNNTLIDQSLNNSLSKQNGAASSNGQNSNGNGGNGGTNMNESNHMFDKILSEVIHVTPYEQRSANASSNLMGDTNLVQEMPIKLKGLIEPAKQQLCLPEGVPSGNTLSVLAAQPPFISDIRLISTLASEANFCINNFTLTVPENVAFDFNPVV